MRYSIIIGNKNYSSWSLRPWLVLKHLGIEFEEILIPLFEDDSLAKLMKHSKSAKVPVLKVDNQSIWDSLAICEFLNDQFPEANLWPKDKMARAVARSLANEMHSGFFEIRNTMPMNLRKVFSDFKPTEACLKEIEYVQSIWTETRNRYGKDGDFLFGKFTIADAMFAPVVTRFQTYSIELSETVQKYSDAVLELPAMQEWKAAGIQESWVIDMDEI